MTDENGGAEIRYTIKALLADMRAEMREGFAAIHAALAGKADLTAYIALNERLTAVEQATTPYAQELLGRFRQMESTVKQLDEWKGQVAAGASALERRRLSAGQRLGAIVAVLFLVTSTVFSVLSLVHH